MDKKKYQESEKIINGIKERIKPVISVSLNSF